MKGLALNVVWALIIAIASVLVFLLLVTGFFKNVANWFYCDVYIKIVNFFTGSEMASIPDICKPFYQQPRIESIKDTDNKIFSRKLSAYIIACWQDAETRGFYESHPCYELKLSGNVENVSEENVTYILIKEDHCRSIENSDYGCGVNNQIIWSIDGDVSLEEENISDAINNCTTPSSLSLDETMIPSVVGIKTKIQLKNFLANDVPVKICASLSQCNGWEYNNSTDEVSFSIDSTIYSYKIDLVISYLEKEGLIRSVIEDQKILLVEYNGPKEAVEVIG